MGAGGFVSQTFCKLAQKEGNGVVALEPACGGADAGGKAFEQAYQSRYHTHIELHAPFAYDATRVLAAAMEKPTPSIRRSTCPSCAPSAIPASPGKLPLIKKAI
nr:Uncharacterised protein [Raoultella sp. NCTC 9187]